MKIKDLIRYALAAAVVLSAAGCVRDAQPAAGHSETPAGKITITLPIDPSDFTKPVVTRAGETIPNPLETQIDNILILVCEGDEIDTSVCVETALAECEGRNIILELTPREGPVWLGIGANAFPEDLYGVTNPQEWLDQMYLNTFLGAFIADDNDDETGSGVFRYDIYFFPGQDNDPIMYPPHLNYIDRIKKPIEMSGVFKSENGVYEGMRPPGGKIKLTRTTAKVTVESQDDEFVPVSMMLYNTPQYGAWHRTSSTILDFSEDGRIITQVYDPSLVVEGTEMALYPFEAPRHNPPVLILNAEYQGVEYTYVLPFIGPFGNRLDIVRNHHYKFIIKEGKPGIEGFDIWENYPANCQDLISQLQLVFRVDVTDMSSHSIIADDDYYLGLSNDQLIVMADTGIAVDNILAVTVTTNFNYYRNDSNQNIYAEGVTGVTTIYENELFLPSVPEMAESTDIHISLPAGVDYGTLTICLGDVERTVTITRMEPYIYNGGGYLLGEDILHAEVSETGSNDWLRGFSLTELSDNPQSVLTRSKKGPVYVHTGDDQGTLDAVFYYTREGGGRTKVIASQQFE